MPNYLSKLHDALNHFRVTINDLESIMAVAMERGATYADIYFEHAYSNNVRLIDNNVDNASSNIEYGAGVRVVVGDQTGYAYTEIATVDELLKAARMANRIASNGEKYNNVNIKELTNPNRYPILHHWEEKSLLDRKPWLEKLNNRIFELDKRVKKVAITQGDGTSDILFFNSEGNIFSDSIPIAMLSATCVMEDDNGHREQAGSSRSFHTGYEFLTEELIEELAQEVVSRTAILFDATKPKGGEMAVVMGAGGSGILLHEAIGHAFEADFNRLGTSIFSDKLGKTICNPLINVVDDGTIPYNRGSINFDDEGIEGQKTYIVTEGRLTSYLHDRISARHYGVKPTGNGRRESFRYTPLPRMRATYMEAGPHSEEEMIANVKKGVYVDVFSNGQVQIGAGDFTFYVKSGWLIENGRLTTPIKDINVIGNGPEALAAISMVGNNPKIDNGTWTCGKDGQSCAVTCGMPSVLVDRLTVGGE
jgi:TldD protein